MTLGVDEVGRGCLAGPVVAGAVVLQKRINGLKDSKKLSKVQREKLAVRINASAHVGIGWVWPNEINELGLTESVRLAMKRAVTQIKIEYDELIVDGNYNFFTDEPRSKAIIKADDTVRAVSAASIVAKVARDNYMASEAHTKFPDYQFDRHVGYGTALHLAALKKFGACELHRLNYKPVRVLMEAAR